MTYLNLREAPLTFKTSLDEGNEELRNDTLKLLPYAHALRDFIQECDTPMTIGIQGDWGIGKTSLMNMLRGTEGSPDSGLLDGANCRGISFDTWPYAQFNHGKDLTIACMHALTAKVGETLSKAEGLDSAAINSLADVAKGMLEAVLQEVRANQTEQGAKVGFSDISARMIQFKREFDRIDRH